MGQSQLFWLVTLAISNVDGSERTRTRLSDTPPLDVYRAALDEAAVTGAKVSMIFVNRFTREEVIASGLKIEEVEG